MSGYDDIKVEAQRSALFETPIVLAKFKGADMLLEDLRQVIKKRQTEDDGMRRSNVGGWHSDTHMLDWGGPAAKTLADKAIAMAKRMSAFADASHDDFDWWCQMWANVSGKGAWNHMHIHPGNLWSAVFYVDLGGAPDGAEGGAFYFEDPRFPIAAMHNTRFRFIDSNGKSQPWQPELAPSPGDMLMFPAWVRHGVRPYAGDRERISIAMNVDAVPR